MKLTRKPSTVEAVRWDGTMTAATLRDALPGVDAMVQNDGTLKIVAGKGGAQGWVPVPVGHWIFTDGSGDDWWPVADSYVQENFDEPESGL